MQSIIEVLCEAEKKVIVWPAAETLPQISNEFQSLGGIPEVIGAVDGCHIHIKAPSETQADYVNRNRKHSINLIAVCTADKTFFFIESGFPGAAHDSSVFESCSLYTKMQNSDTSYFPSPDYYIVGDSAFFLNKYLMVPFQNTGNLSDSQVKYNEKLSKARVTIEHAFGLLKARFRRLERIDARIERIPKLVKAYCVLHNIALRDPQDTVFMKREVVTKMSVQVSDIAAESPHTEQREALDKRWAIVRML